MKPTAKKILLYSIFLFLIGIVLANVYEIGLCKTLFCFDIVEDGIGVPVGFFSIVLFVLSFILLFLREEIFQSWWKFTKIFIPISLLLILVNSFSSHGSFLAGSLGFDAELTTWWTAGLFFIISLIIIVYRTISIRRKEKLPRANS